jgi:hypothetical protein
VGVHTLEKGANKMSVNLQLDKMTTEEKLRTMEELWVDLTRNQDSYESPAWHETVLKEREQRVKEGRATFIDWEQAKREIRDRVETSMPGPQAKT